MLMISEAHDVRIIGSITLLLLLGVTQAGMAWESKAQVGLLIILIISIMNYLVGCCLDRSFDYEAFTQENKTDEIKFKKVRLKQRSVDTSVHGLSASCPCPLFFEKVMSEGSSGCL